MKLSPENEKLALKLLTKALVEVKNESEAMALVEDLFSDGERYDIARRLLIGNKVLECCKSSKRRAYTKTFRELAEEIGCGERSVSAVEA